MINIFSTIRQELNDFINNSVNIVDGYDYNQLETVKKNHRYISSKYASDKLINGKKKIFFNIVKTPCQVASRFLNFDTKDIRLYATNPGSWLKTFLLEKELKNWFKKSVFASTLNEIAEKLPVYGSCVLKKTKNGADFVDLRRLANDPTVKRITDSRFITITHYFTEEQLRKKTKDGWENVEDAIAKFGSPYAPNSYEDNSIDKNEIRSSKYIKVHERFGEVPLSWITGKEKDTEMVRAVFIVAGAENYRTNEQGQYTGEEGTILFKSKWSGKYPFRDFHFYKVDGRWLGVGAVEDLWDTQERINELANIKRISMELSSMHIFQTRDKTILKNLMKDLENGAIIPAGPNGGLEPVANEERNLSAFQLEETRYDNHSKDLTFSYDAVRGEQMPSSMPATNAVIQDRNTVSVFGFKRENLAIDLKEFFREFVLPQLVKDLTPEHILRYTGSVEEINKLDDLILNGLVREDVIEKILSGRVILPGEIEIIRDEINRQLKKKGAERFITIKEKYYDDVEFDFDFIIGNEQEDSQLLTQNIFTLLTTLAKNPQLLDDPRVKALFYEYSEKVGVNPAKFELAEAQRAEQVSQMPQQPAQGNIPMAQAVGQEQQTNQPLK